MNNLLKIKNVKAYYSLVDGVYIKAVDDVSIDIRENEVLGIAGESGCGKSTLSLVMSLNLNPPLYLIDGEIIVDGKNIVTLDKEALRKEFRGKYISIVPQGAMNSLNPTQRIKNFIIDVYKEHFPEITKEEALKIAKERLEILSLPQRILNAYPHQLSGGMKQRTVTIISTLLNPKILIADEPTSALDVSSQKVVIKMFLDLLRLQIIKSIVFITHELPLLRHIANRIAIMYAGKIVEIGPRDKIIFSPFHPYTKLLLSSVLVPEPGIKNKRVESIPGVPPDLKNPPEGCRFYPRCPSRIVSLCDKEVPPYIEIEKDHKVSCYLYGGN
ncbi:MAG: ABC transporter ATP-binding protein [Dictyoglomaceae bacterium]|nr:ABC transporter ATP-binding protein [Dictyoglomaceae bacterium]